MLESMFIGATGMQAQQVNLDVIANNLANVNTAGFKKNSVKFQDLMYRAAGIAPSSVLSLGDRVEVGIGTSVARTAKNFAMGELKSTDDPMSVAIQGEGFFEVTLADGSLGYSRNGSLKVDRDGMLATADGHVLTANIRIPQDVKELVIKGDGHVLASYEGEKQLSELGLIDLASFVNPTGLEAAGEGLFKPTLESGQPYYGQPGDGSFGSLAQRYVESSNVDLTSELIDLMLAQRAYEINSKVVQASDELLALANNMRR